MTTMKSVSVTDFKAHCLRLIEEVARTGEALLLTKRGKEIARVEPSGEKRRWEYRSGLFRDSIKVVGDIASPLDVEWEALS